ncbi:adhesion G protein-coupled receptor F5-like [Hoplias malabaricus]|uniref:adhesion G protein-coupled receptor F5-like n=1 Tax=Hoplias malabaricus TaxID=27720 RepID=UPI003461C6FD
MATERSESKCLLICACVLLMFMHEVHMHEIIQTSDYTSENRYMDGHFNPRHKRAAITGQTEYVAVVQLTTSSQIPVSVVKNLLSNLKLPSTPSSSEIIGFNLTAVCQPVNNESLPECTCEDSYVWSYNACSHHKTCGATLGACNCIVGLPSLGQMCVPLTVFDFTVQIQTNAQINTIKSLLQTSNNVYADNILRVLEVNLTTACQSSSAGYQCICEDNYFWPCDTCMSYGYCDAISNDTCGCIKGLPANGTYCQLITDLNRNIQTCPVTTPRPPIPTTPPANPPRPPIPDTPPIPTSPPEITITLSMTINQAFDLSLTNPTSQAYISNTSIITSSVDSVYTKVLTSYKTGSVHVMRYRSGSVIADFSIVTTSNTISFSEANSQLISDLRAKGINANSFAQTVENGLYIPNSYIYPGDPFTLRCTPPDSNYLEISWSMNNNPISNARYQISPDKQTLTVTNANNEDNGLYLCTLDRNTIPYIIFQNIVIQPLPSVNVNFSKTLECKGSNFILVCCADSSYKVQWTLNTAAGDQAQTSQQTGCNTYVYSYSTGDCQTSDKTERFTCQVYKNNGNLYSSNPVTITLTSRITDFDCYNDRFGGGNKDQTQKGDCDADSSGNVIAKCVRNSPSKGNWVIVEDNCILRALQNLANIAEHLLPEGILQFVAELQGVTTTNADKITGSPINVFTIVNLMSITATVSQSVKINETIMDNFLQVVDVMASTSAQNTWILLNNGTTTQNTSSKLLNSTEFMGRTLRDDNFQITTNTTQLNRTITTAPFFGKFGINSTTQIAIPQFNGRTSITIIVFSSLDNVLPVRNETYNGTKNITKINADVTSVVLNNTVINISLTFDIRNTSLRNPQCVFWNFQLLNGTGGWDSTGCEVKPLNGTEQVSCECNHTTSFSILMSPFALDSLILSFITYIGVGISMICLILALIIEGIVWRALTRNETSFMRHVSIVNIALSLLIADICFIIAANVVNYGEKTPVGPCSAATFFMHFFYLALFFWMLFSALLLFYRTVMVLSRTSKCIMVTVAFTLGYGGPLLIAVITVASTAGGGVYVSKENACWLNWYQSKALLAFVIPALTIVAINFLILIVVLFKLVRRGVGATTQPDEKHAIVVIARCVVILTPLFGLTWAFGIGTLVSSALGIQIVFSVLNSLQGFFIFVFGVLFDSKIREELAGKFRKDVRSRSGQTKSTSAGNSSSTGIGFRERFRRRRGYQVSDSSGFLSSSNSDAFLNT